jgi:cytochrome P450
MVACTERMMAAWHDGEVRDIHLDMMRLALEIVAKALFNVEITAERDRIAGALNTFMELGSRGRMLLPPTSSPLANRRQLALPACSLPVG